MSTFDLYSTLPPLHPAMFQPPPPPPPPPPYHPSHHSAVLQPPPPPPPPRSNGSASHPASQTHSRRTSSIDGSTGPLDKGAVLGNNQYHDRPRSASQMSTHSQDGTPCGADCSHDAMVKLEAKLTNEIMRVRQESQVAHKAILAEFDRMTKERDVCWKHVAELKEQNRLLRQRNCELEVQNSNFTLHVTTLQEQLSALAEAASQLQSLKGAFGSFPGIGTIPSMPKVPHSGADIW